MNGDSSPLAQDVRPGKWLYGVAAAIFVAGWVWFGVFLWMSLSSIGKRLEQVVVPGTAELSLPMPGKYTIFHEYQSVVGSRIYSTSQDISGLDCSLRNKATGAPVEVSRSNTNSTYSLGGRSGVSFLEFNIKQPGIYILSAKYAGGEEGPEVVLAVGQISGLWIFATVLASLAIIFGCIGASVAIAVYTGVKRYKAFQHLRVGNAL